MNSIADNTSRVTESLTTIVETYITYGDGCRQLTWPKAESISFDTFSDDIRDIPEIGHKDGRCFVPGALRGKRRLADEVARLDLAVLDSDCGHPLNEIQLKVQEHGWRAVIHSTYSHLTTRSEFGKDLLDKWLKAGGTVAGFMAQKGYLPSVFEGAAVDDEAEAPPGKVWVKHKPCSKYRVILPLARPWIAAEYGSQAEACDAWAGRLRALAAVLGLRVDKSCTDTSRLYYLPRVKDAAAREDFESAPIDGAWLDIFALPDAPADFDCDPRQASFSTVEGISRIGSRIEWTDTKTGEVVNLTAWAANFARHFQIADALRARETISGRSAGFSQRAARGKPHIFCPLADEHLSGTDDGTGCFVCNASDAPNVLHKRAAGGFAIHCSHNGCAEKDRLDFLAGLLSHGRLTIEDLSNPEFLYDMPLDVNIGADFQKAPEPAQDARITEHPTSDGEEKKQRDKTRAKAYATIRSAREKGAAFEQACDAVKADPALSEWFDRYGAKHDGKELRKLWEKAGAELGPQRDGMPKIAVVAGDLSSIVSMAENALLRADLGLYQRGPDIVGTGYLRIKIARNGEVDAQSIVAKSPGAVLEAFDRAAVWVKWDNRSESYKTIDPPKNYVEVYMSRVGQWHLPVLAGIINAPTLRADGTLLDVPGYDAKSGLIFDPRGVKFPDINREPSMADALASLGRLKALLATVPFVKTENANDDRNPNRAAALSAIMTAMAPELLFKKPMHATTAPTAGSGKSMLANIPSIIAIGHEVGIMDIGTDKAELEKQLNAYLLAGRKMICIDNVEPSTTLGGAKLAQVLSQNEVDCRVLGETRTVTSEADIFIMANGNNLTIKGDLCRRTILCSIDPELERPELRKFTSDPEQEAKDNRPQLVADVLTIFLAYQHAGFPEKGKNTPLASFRDWSHWVRDALIWLGEADPLLTQADIRKHDPILETAASVMGPWAEIIGGKGITVSQVKLLANEVACTSDPHASHKNYDFKYAAFRDALVSVSGEKEIDSQRLGIWIRATSGRIIRTDNGCFQFKEDGKHCNSVRWKLVAADDAGKQTLRVF